MAILALSACNHAAPPPTTQLPLVTLDPREHLSRLVERYWESRLILNPTEATAIGDRRFNAHLEDTASLQYLADSLALERSALAELLTLPADKLNGRERLSYEIFKEERETAIRSFTFPEELLPVNQISGMPQTFAQMGSGAGIHPFDNSHDYLDWLSRIDDFVRWKTDAIANMREGVRRGYVLPRVVVQRLLPQLSALSQDRPDNPFYGPMRAFPQGVNAADRARLTSGLSAAVRTKILPAYRELHDFLRNEYMPVARTSVGLSALPMGEAWYADRVKRATTTSMTPAQVHALGLAEVERIKTRLLAAGVQVGFAGNLSALFAFLAHDPRFYFASADELMNAYRELKPKALAAAANLFVDVPTADFEIREVEEFRRASASAAAYQTASPDGRRPGVFYVNTFDLPSRPRFAVPALFLHEAVPGHHLQSTIQLEQRELPKFRRFGDVTAFQEGWGLYAEGLGEDLGFFADPYARIGALISELRRALRLVVDTGINAKGWTRQQGIDYLLSQMPIGDSDAATEVERYMAIPGQGLAYTVGALKFREIRSKAQQLLGSRFEVRAFNSELLRDGAMPLDLLESKMSRWIRAVQTSPAVAVPLPAVAPPATGTVPAGMPAAGTPAAGTPTARMPATGMPATGSPATGSPVPSIIPACVQQS